MALMNLFTEQQWRQRTDLTDKGWREEGEDEMNGEKRMKSVH